MALDSLLIAGLANELNRVLEGARIDKIYMPRRDRVVLNLRLQQGSGKLLLGFVFIQLINCKGKGTILFQLHILSGCVQPLYSTVSAPIAVISAGTVIVIHLCRGDLVNLDCVGTVPLEILVCKQGSLTLRLKLFISVGLEFSC